MTPRVQFNYTLGSYRDQRLETRSSTGERARAYAAGALQCSKIGKYCNKCCFTIITYNSYWLKSLNVFFQKIPIDFSDKPVMTFPKMDKIFFLNLTHCNFVVAGRTLAVKLNPETRGSYWK